MRLHTEHAVQKFFFNFPPSLISSSVPFFDTRIYGGIEVHSVSCLVRAPEICVEVLSASNTTEEISEKDRPLF
jgi:hypothetical protein